MSWAWWRATWREEERDRVFFFMRIRFSLSLSLSLDSFLLSAKGHVVASLPPSPQWKISSQLCKKEFHQKMKEKHTQDKESRDCTSPKAAVFKNTRNNDSPTQIKKKTQSTQQKFKPRILTFFFKSQKREKSGHQPNEEDEMNSQIPPTSCLEEGSV